MEGWISHTPLIILVIGKRGWLSHFKHKAKERTQFHKQDMDDWGGTEKFNTSMTTISWEPMIATLKRLLPKKKGKTGKMIVGGTEKFTPCFCSCRIHLKSLIVRNPKPTFPSQWPCLHLPIANTTSENKLPKNACPSLCAASASITILWDAHSL